MWVPGWAQLGDGRGSSGEAVTAVKAISAGLKVAVLLVMSAAGVATGCVSPGASASVTLVTLAPPAGVESAATASSDVRAPAIRHRRDMVILGGLHASNSILYRERFRHRARASSTAFLGLTASSEVRCNLVQGRFGNGNDERAECPARGASYGRCRPLLRQSGNDGAALRRCPGRPTGTPLRAASLGERGGGHR